jgi:hypothetical protein
MGSKYSRIPKIGPIKTGSTIKGNLTRHLNKLMRRENQSMMAKMLLNPTNV